MSTKLLLWRGGTRGGLARVATLRQQLYKDNPRTYTLLAGDAFSPSALGTAKINGTPLAGQQMVAVMNALEFDYATFGNHEFDLPENLFNQRLQESRFRWVSSNVSDDTGKAFKGVPRSIVFNVKGDRFLCQKFTSCCFCSWLSVFQNKGS